MSIQRWVWTNRVGEAVPTDDGAWVTYADHVAAVAEAETRQYGKAWDDLQKTRHLDYQQGYAAALDAARKAVAALPCDSYEITVSRQTVLDAIDALRGAE